MKLFVVTTMAALCAAMGQSASAAQDTPAPIPAFYGVFSCRIAANHEMPAERAPGFDAMLVCEPLHSIGVLKPDTETFPRRRPIDAAFDASHVLSPMQMNDAWRTYVDRTFSIDHSP